MRRRPRDLRERRRGAFLLDVTLALFVFLASFTAFLTLANDKSHMLDDTASQMRVMANAEAELSRLALLPYDDLLEASTTEFPCPGIPGDRAVGTVQVLPTPIPGVLRIDVLVTWVGASGHSRRFVLSTFRPRHGLLEATALPGGDR
jgi:hypothetical protein